MVKKAYIWLPFSLLFLVAFYECYGYFYDPSIYKLDSELGWTAKPSFSKDLIQQSESGEQYLVHYETNALGLRTYGQDTKEAIKFLVIGDSFTMEPYAGNNQMWYSAFANNLNASGFQGDKNIFISAGGGGGWGTLQQLLLLKRVQKEVKPDFFILQFCANDFINNHLSWEGSTITRSQQYRRPYQVLDGGIEFSNSFLAPLWRNSIFGQSKIFNQVDVLIQIFQSKIYKGYGPTILKFVQDQYETESVEITTRVLREMREQLSDIPAYMINCSSDKNGPNKYWSEIAHRTGFIPLISASDANVRRMTSLDNTTVIDSIHLNFRGNIIYGALVAKDFLNNYKMQAKLKK